MKQFFSSKEPNVINSKYIVSRSCQLVSLLCLATIVSASFVSPAACQEKAKDVYKNKTTVMAMLEKQVEAWNAGDLEKFMETYWNSPDLTFSGGGKTTRGWQATLDRYKATYSTKEKMGTLRFGTIEFQQLSNEVCLVLGTWHLKTDTGEPEGNFSIVLKKFDETWKIVHDHSSTLKK